MVQQLLKFDKIGPYSPTIKDINLWFAILNQLIFRGKIPEFTSIILKHRPTRWGACMGFEEDGKRWCCLEMDTEFTSFDGFIAILAHEMIHNYQWNILNREMSHGLYFFVWKKKLKKHDIPLQIRYGKD